MTEAAQSAPDLFGLDKLIYLVHEWGAVMVLAGFALVFLLAAARRYWFTQHHDAQLSGDTAGVYQQMLADARTGHESEKKRCKDLQEAIIELAREGNKAHREETQRDKQEHAAAIKALEHKYEALLAQMTTLREDCERRDSERSRENAALWSVTTAEQRLALAEQGITPFGSVERRSGADRRKELRPAEITP